MVCIFHSRWFGHFVSRPYRLTYSSLERPCFRVARRQLHEQKKAGSAAPRSRSKEYLSVGWIYGLALSPFLLFVLQREFHFRPLYMFENHHRTHGLIPASSTLQQLSQVADLDQVSPQPEQVEQTPGQRKQSRKPPTQFVIGAGERLTRPDVIRLLTIYPDDDAETPVRCSLQQTLHSIAPEYEALSYCRTTVSGTDMIICDGQTLTVPQSLSDALKAIRLTGETRTLWVDAVCIDQDDVEDRSLQVRNIGKIFSRASLVWVYLGKDGDAKGAIDVIERVSRGATFRNLSQIKTVLQLLELPWFERLWVVQEVCQADQVVVVHGDCWVPWSYVEKVVSFLHGRLVQSGIGRHVHSQSIDRVQTLIRLRHKTEDPMARHDLLDLVFATQNFKVSDPRDRIFALVGLADDVSEADWELSPDYSSETDDVYRRFALWSLAKRGDLRILSWPRLLGGNPDLSLPTWVPDLSATSHIPAPELLAVRDEVADENEALSFAGSGPQPRLPRRLREMVRPRRHRYADGIERPFLSLGNVNETRTQETFANLSRVSFSSDNKVLHLVGWKVTNIMLVGELAFTESPETDMNVLFLLGISSKRWSSKYKNELIKFMTWKALESKTWLSDCVKLARMAGLGPQSLLPQQRAMFDPFWRTLCCDRLWSGRLLDEVNEDLYYNLSNLLPANDLNTQISHALGVSEFDLAKLADSHTKNTPNEDVTDGSADRRVSADTVDGTAVSCELSQSGVQTSITPSPGWDDDRLPSCFDSLRAANPVKNQPWFHKRWIPSTNKIGITDVLQRNQHVMRHLWPTIVKWSRSRRIALTSDRQLANVHPSTQEGDIVCIFFGASVPYILRPREDGYFELIGECYVDGIMRGDAVYNAMNMEYTRPLQAVFAIK